VKNAFTAYIRKASRPYIDALRDDIKARRDPDFFWPTGTQVYCGRQGSGKTVSAVKHVSDMKDRYPRAIVVSNVKLLHFDRGRHFTNAEELKQVLQDFNPEKEYILFKTMEELALVLTKINNGKYGVIYVVDEIHTYLNALDSANVPMYVFTEISQQRKQRKLIIATSQLFMRMAKPLREQCDNLIICRTFMGVFTTQTVFDGMTLEQQYDGSIVGKPLKKGWFFHNRHIRNSFDTYQKVVSGSEQYEAIQRVEVSGRGKRQKIAVSAH
jgi:zonular occludens toxin Zot